MVLQQEIEEIYKNAMIKRSQKEIETQQKLQEDLEKQFWVYAQSRIETLLKKIVGFYQLPNISKNQIDQAQKEFSEFLDLVNMNTLPEVIDELIYRELKIKKFQKMKEESKIE